MPWRSQHFLLNGPDIVWRLEFSVCVINATNLDSWMISCKCQNAAKTFYLWKIWMPRKNHTEVFWSIVKTYILRHLCSFNSLLKMGCLRFHWFLNVYFNSVFSVVLTCSKFINNFYYIAPRKTCTLIWKVTVMKPFFWVGQWNQKFQVLFDFSLYLSFGFLIYQ